MGELRGEESVGPATYFFITDGQKRDYLSRASQRARGATKSSSCVVLGLCTAFYNVMINCCASKATFAATVYNQY